MRTTVASTYDPILIGPTSYAPACTLPSLKHPPPFSSRFVLMVHGTETFDVAANEVPKTKEEEDTIRAIVKVRAFFATETLLAASRTANVCVLNSCLPSQLTRF